MAGGLPIAEFNHLFQDVEGAQFQALFAEYEAMRNKVEAVAAIASGELYTQVMDFFLQGNCDREHPVSSLMAERVFLREGAVKALNATFWSRALSMTDVYQAMP